MDGIAEEELAAAVVGLFHSHKQGLNSRRILVLSWSCVLGARGQQPEVCSCLCLSPQLNPCP